MEYYVYILYSESAGKFYIGQTNNIQGRLERHNSGTENATRPYRPWVLKWYGVKSSRADAMFLEIDPDPVTKTIQFSLPLNSVDFKMRIFWDDINTSLFISEPYEAEKL